MKPLRFDAPSASLFGVRVHSVTLSAALDIVDQAISRRERLQISVLNAAKVVNMRRDPTLRDDVVGSDIVLADRIAVVWSSCPLGLSLPERVTGIDRMVGILDRGNLKNYFLLLSKCYRRSFQRCRRETGVTLTWSQARGSASWVFFGGR